MAGECRGQLGDFDLESVALDGASILESIKNFKKARNVLGAYRTEAMERGMINTRPQGDCPGYPTGYGIYERACTITYPIRLTEL